MQLIYVGDPMCSWCYGFGNILTELTETRPDLPLKIVVGGIRAGATDILDDAGKRFRLQHWTRVEQASGLQFNRKGFLAREGFVYDTEPICRAVVTARAFAPGQNSLPLFRTLQRAFYIDARDTTATDVLVEVAAGALADSGLDVSKQAFRDLFESDNVKQATQADFSLARSWGISSFPSLLVEDRGQLQLLATGFTSLDILNNRLNKVLGERAFARHE